MKDFYDIWRMSEQFDFHSEELCEAVRGTFENRRTEVIEFDDLALDLAANENLGKHWNAFLRKSALTGPDDFAKALVRIKKFLAPVFSSILRSKPSNRIWQAGGPWVDS